MTSFLEIHSMIAPPSLPPSLSHYYRTCELHVVKEAGVVAIVFGGSDEVICLFLLLMISDEDDSEDTGRRFCNMHSAVFVQ